MCSQNLGLFSSLSFFIKFQYITFQENLKKTFHKLRNVLWLKFSAWRSWKPEWGLKVSRNAFVGQFLSNAMHLSANEVFPSNLSFFNFENSFGWNGRQTLIMGSPWWQVNMFFVIIVVITLVTFCWLSPCKIAGEQEKWEWWKILHQKLGEKENWLFPENWASEVIGHLFDYCPHNKISALTTKTTRNYPTVIYKLLHYPKFLLIGIIMFM